MSGRLFLMLSAEVVHFNKLLVSGIKSHILIFTLRLGRRALVVVITRRLMISYDLMFRVCSFTLGVWEAITSAAH